MFTRQAATVSPTLLCRAQLSSAYASVRAFGASDNRSRKPENNDSKPKKVTGPPSALNPSSSPTIPESGKFDVDNPQTTLISYDAARLPQTTHGAIDVRTHTGQFWEESDYRLARFQPEFAQKLVNRRFAIDLVNSVPPIERKERIVFCDGGGNPALGHPKVFMNLDKPGPQACGYCGLRFVKSDDHHH